MLCHVLGWWRVTSPAPRMLFGVRLSRGEGPRLAFSGCRQANSLKCLKSLQCVAENQSELENANKCARILHVWQSFVAENPEFLLQKFNYKPKIGKAAGQLGKMFALFRDQVLPAALKYGMCAAMSKLPRCRQRRTGTSKLPRGPTGRGARAPSKAGSLCVPHANRRV